MIIESIKRRIGAHFISALINGDTTGLDDYEDMMLNEWLADAMCPWEDADGTRWEFAHISTIDNMEEEFGLCEVTNLRGQTLDVLMNFYPVGRI
jgi:hypothetical protein